MTETRSTVLQVAGLHWATSEDVVDVPIALRIARGTVRTMRQNLGWAVGWNAIALPIAAGVFEPAFGLMPRPEIAALTRSGSSAMVAINAVMLRRLRLPSADAARVETAEAHTIDRTEAIASAAEQERHHEHR